MGVQVPPPAERISLSVQEARRVQEKLRGRVREEPPPEVRWVAGLDVSFVGDWTLAVAVAGPFPRFVVREWAIVRRRTDFPYIPGLLAFREVPAMREALARLRRRPDLLLVDAHGRAHPRRFGAASHLGVLEDLPAIGVAKSRLVGQYEDPAPVRGSWSPLVENGEVLGLVLRTRSRVKPVFVSVGHRVTLPIAREIVLALSRFREPEPLRWAHRISQWGKRWFC